jgi:hypothetical protein
MGARNNFTPLHYRRRATRIQITFERAYELQFSTESHRTITNCARQGGILSQGVSPGPLADRNFRPVNAGRETPRRAGLRERS